MTTKQKQPSEENFNQFRKELDKRVSQEIMQNQNQNIENIMTWFGRHPWATLQFGKRLSEFKDSNEIIRVNNIGIGIRGIGDEGERVPPNMKSHYISYEPLELLNQAAKILEPKQLIFYAADTRMDTLLHLKSTKTVRMHEYLHREYFKAFFPEVLHRKEGDNIAVDIPEEWKDRIVYLKLNILKQPAPVKAHVTFSYILDLYQRPEYFENLVASTKRGGYVFCAAGPRDETLKKLNVEWIHPVRYPEPGLLHLR